MEWACTMPLVCEAEQVLDLQKAKDAQAKEIAALQKRIQRLERRKITRPTVSEKIRRLRQNDDLMFAYGVLEDDVMHVEAKVDGKDEQSKKSDDSTAGEAVTTASIDDSTAGEAVTTASIDDSAVPTTSEEITLAQTLIQIKEPSEFRVPQETQPSSSKDKGKGIMIEPEVPLNRKDQIALDEQIARDIQAKLDAELLEDQKLARKQEETNIALIKKAKKRWEEGFREKQTKKQKVEEEKESEEVDEVELKKLLAIKKDEDIAIDAIPLTTKLPVIVDYKLLKDGMLVHYQLIRADGSSKKYSSMIRMLQGIDREDLEALWRIVKAKYGG
ncbi:hypothetical protein Tco_1237327 [Tanacetum coccineum]